MSILVAVLSLLASVVAGPAGTPAAPSPARHAVWPLAPRPEIARGFVAPADAWSAGHRGVDLVGHPGQAVRSTLPGRVTFAGSIAGRGVVVVDHGAFRTTYEPVDAVLAVGAPTQAGTEIGTLEAAPSHCAPRTCLHWGLIEGETYRDPLTLLGLGPIRLMPVGAPARTPSGAGPW